jgi:two-component system OmpR family response regulator
MLVKPTILVAEDDAGIREVIITRLVQAGFDARGARTGLEVLSSIRAQRPQAMILDINMPELDGFGVLEALAKTQIGRIPTLVLSARHAADDVKRAVRLGAMDYLTKPFNHDQLLGRVGRLLRIAQPGPPATTAVVWREG